MSTKIILPPSLPPHWPQSSAAELEESPERVVHLGTPQTYSFRSNFVKTSKYEIINFLPKFLFEEFNPKTKVANSYFLFIAILQCIPVISNTGGLPTVLLPLLVVVLIDAVFAALEDIGKHDLKY